MGGPDGDLVRQRGEAPERAVLGAGQLVGAVGAEEVGAGGGVRDGPRRARIGKPTP
ncbi:hypothetical protein ABZ589_06840 [Streptomyces sp. NPDC013313]|uniref:hypothetical protein n=1 Tax=Streptomyces sp. NPDC013313 TaxID=3155603 RepID=UPI0033FA0BD0